MDAILQDLKYAARALAKSPGFTSVALLTLALGIGATTAIFSVIHSVLLQPLPYPDPGRLVHISATDLAAGATGIPVSLTKFERMQQTQALGSIAANYSLTLGLTGRGEPEEVPAERVTLDFFRALGVAPAMGRGFLPAEDQLGGADVALITDAFWHSHFGGDPSAIGRTISLDGKSTTIVGILPSSFRFPFEQPEPQIWLPRVFEILGLRPAQLRAGAGFLSVMGRLKPGESIASAQAEMDAISRAYGQELPGNADAGKHGLIVTSLEENLVGGVRASLIAMLVAVGFVLLIACANVANLLLARATTREREIAIRRALGASRRRLVRQLLTESLLLSLLGGGIGVVVAGWCLPMFRLVAPGSVPRLDEIRLDGAVLLFSLGICVLTGIAFGLAPSWQFSRRDLHDTLKEGGRSATDGGRGGRLRRWMVVAEVAVALVLVTGAGLLLRSFTKLARVNPGFDARNVTTFPISLPASRYSEPAQRASFFRRLVDGVRAISGVQSAGAVTYLPLNGAGRYVFFCPEGRVCEGIGKDPLVSLRQVTPGFLEMMRIPLLRGRTFTEKDTQDSQRVVVINETVANRYFPNQNPIGKTLRNSREMIPLEIIGVVGHTKITSLSAPEFPEMYLASEQYPWPTMTLAVRSDSNPQPLIAAVRRKIAELDPDIAVAGISPMEKVVASSVAQPRLVSQLVGAFAVFALALAAVGIYGVMAYSVTQRAHEMGIRMAIGAEPRDIFRLVVGQALRLVMTGAALGLIASLALTRLMKTLLYGTAPTDPLTFAAVVALLAGIALAASYIPARRAMRVDPIEALRYE